MNNNAIYKMLNSDEYTIWNNSTIIIYSNVNKMIDFNLNFNFKKINKIIFSNYDDDDDGEICVETSNKYDREYEEH